MLCNGNRKAGTGEHGNENGKWQIEKNYDTENAGKLTNTKNIVIYYK